MSVPSLTPILSPYLVPAAQLHPPLSSHLLPLMFCISCCLSSLNLPPSVIYFSPLLLRPLLGSDTKAIQWTRLSQTVHRNKVHCCLPCTMGNQLIDVYWHTVY